MTAPRPSRLLLPLLCCAPLLAGAAPLTLEQALQQAGDSGPAANAELEARYAARDQRESESGWEMFGNANVGRYRELVTDDVRDDYYGRSFAVGVRYPLLGSLRRRMDAVRDSERDIRLAEIEQGYRRAQQRLAIRSTYADWWRASEEKRLCEGVEQAARDAEEQVQTRLKGNWILPSDAQLMRSEWTAVTQRCAMQQGLLEDIRASLQTLGVQVEANDTPITSPLASEPQPLQAWQEQLESNPRVAGRNAELANAELGRKQPWYSAIESYVNVAQTLEQRSGASDNGSGLSAGVTFSAPFDLLDYGSARGREGEARYQAAVQALERERGSVLRELGKVLEQQRRELNEYQWRSERRAALDTIIAERRQRGSLDAGEASLRLLQAQVDHYNAGFAQISAWHGAWLQDSALRLFGDDSPGFERLLGNRVVQWQSDKTVMPAQVATQAQWNQGVYIWDSTALLDPSQRPGQLSTLQQAGISQLHVGLTSLQVADIRRTHQAMRELIQAAHAKGMQVSLLLGDPDWMKPRQRHGLIDLIGKLRDLPFAALHLDLEVEQLGWPVPDGRLRDWLDTVREAKAAAPWPLNLSSHPRWFDEQANRQPCVPCELQRIGVGEISLMIYTRNPQSSANRALAIAKQWPALKLRLAQSVEADQPADLSWADASHEQLQQQVVNWQNALRPAGVGGIDWQSWTDYPRSR
ncbi:hypothetical protein [Phytopseudomonas punonensis]|uniref:Outer membrane protein TolC n=1 Tax=Phytopseudomonas punonensis TaxID=1220495 RepID=A0A1M6XGM7_9GAMM|nr:hypothetical protein [Pseudomonas punonensis]SHL05106.1 Outer membrane protein TolC [Pseudomonas punonensis]